jgi:hypothetical protein
MLVTYNFWAVLNDAKKCGPKDDGRNHNYHLTMDREFAEELYQQLVQEFG